MNTAALYVLWTDELQDAFNRLAAQEGSVSAAARRLEMTERLFYNYRHGRSCGKFGPRTGGVRPRKFLSLHALERLAIALGELELEDREALTRRGWSDRGEWSWGPASPQAEDGRFVRGGT